MANGPDARATVRRLSDAVVEIDTSGQLTATSIRETAPRILDLMRTGDVKAVVISGSKQLSLDGANRSAVIETTDKVLAAGAQLIVAIVPNAAVRMIGTAMAFAAGHPVKLVADRASAMAILRERGWL